MVCLCLGLRLVFSVVNLMRNGNKSLINPDAGHSSSHGIYSCRIFIVGTGDDSRTGYGATVSLTYCNLGLVGLG